MKIVIIGYSGSGKSTLAGALSRHYSIPKLHMDTLQFQPGWVDSDRDWMEGQMKQFLSQHKDWVIDGNYSWCCYEERMEQADHIIFLNFSRWNCLYRAWKRYRRYKGDAFARVWQQAALNALTGNSSVGSFGTVELRMPKKGIEISVLPIPINSSLSRIKKSWMHF